MGETKQRKSLSPEVRRRRLAYDREAKRMARQSYLYERDHLAKTIERLTLKLYALRGTLLPWKEVATALRGTRQSSMQANEYLRHQVNQYATVASHLSRWVETMQPSPGLKHSSTWQTVTLAEDDYVRQVGFSWISKQLYFAADSQLPPDLFPPAHEDDVRIEWGVGGRRLIKQKLIPGRRQDVAKALWIVNGATASGLCGTPVDVEILHQEGTDADKLHYVRETYRGKTAHVLHKAVVEADRTLSMFRMIRHDARCPTPDLPETFQEWNEIRQISPENCLVRSVCWLEPVAEFDSMLAYSKELFPDVYRTASLKDSSPAVALEDLVHQELLRYAKARTERYFDNVAKVLESIVDPFTLRYQTL
ncbi:hypothetical protein ACHHYP_13102 [Achlya hypogyna]|uniref:Uncharacterized protein n=1 Tax=Achlya hypogyna TaxID=1202772 RepID=A0A1V9YFY3_ACHHY|nr:hypothetical protein ACHHYP_13102 [Achlya hypogyna]